MAKKPDRLLAGVSVPELLAMIPSPFLEQLAEELMVDTWVRKLKAEGVFKLVLFSLLQSERLSLRVMEENSKDPYFKALYPAFEADKATWVGIRNRLIQLDLRYCRRLYETVYERALALYGEKALSGYHIKRYDSTMIATFSHLLEGMRVGNTKKGKTQVKLTTELRDDFLIQMHFHKDQGHLSEELALKEAIEASEHSNQEIVVFDKGLKSRQSFSSFEQAGIGFVARSNGVTRYELIEAKAKTENDPPGLEWLEDSTVYLYESGHNLVETQLRLIRYRIRETGEILCFITNLWHLPASVIAQAYRRRWDIEVLFRFMKQEMNLTHFVCNDEHAIQVMLYFTMIAAMLVLIYKKHNRIRSYKMAKIQFFKELIYTLTLDVTEEPETLKWFRGNLKKLVLKE